MIGFGDKQFLDTSQCPARNVLFSVAVAFGAIALNGHAKRPKVHWSNRSCLFKTSDGVIVSSQGNEAAGSRRIHLVRVWIEPQSQFVLGNRFIKAPTISEDATT